MVKRAVAESMGANEMYHPDEPKVTKDGFYLRDSDDSDAENQEYSSSDDEDSGEERKNVKANPGNKKQGSKHAPRVSANKLNTASDSKSKSLAMEGTEQTMGLSNRVNNQLKQTEDKLDKNRMRKKDKADKATVDDCLDERTMTVMNKLLDNEKLNEFGGCIATGKEANVYSGQGSWDFETRNPFEPDENYDIPVKDYAIKIFKTSVQTFKDRERYVQGEFRFRHGGYKKNPRKMIRMWAEKEVRNLKRIAEPDCLIPVPYPHYLKNNVIVMDFLGDKDGTAAPRLRDANLEDWSSAYEQTLLILRRLYTRCKLIHADLSEYNLLYHNDKVYVIDVS